MFPSPAKTYPCRGNPEVKESESNKLKEEEDSETSIRPALPVLLVLVDPVRVGPAGLGLGPALRIMVARGVKCNGMRARPAGLLSVDPSSPGSSRRESDPNRGLI
jgi:hypothetical protein